MALPARKQPNNDDLNNSGSPAAANDNIEINKVSSGLKKAEIKDNKLKISFKSPKIKLSGGPVTANDNVEDENIQPEKITTPKKSAPINQAPLPEKPTNIAGNKKTPSGTDDFTKPSAPVKKPDLNTNTSSPSPKNQVPKTAPQENIDQPTQPNNIIPQEPQLPIAEESTPTTQPEQAQNDQNPEFSPNTNPEQGDLNNTKKMYGISDANPNLNKQPQTKPISDELSQTGPHISDKTPTTVKPNDQTKKASDLSQSKSLAGSIGAGISNKINDAKQAISEAPKNLVSKIKNNLQSDRSRKKQLGQERKQLESELRKLEGKIDGVRSSMAMRIIRYALPTVYSTLMGFTLGIKNANDKAKLPILEAKLNSIKTVKGILATVKTGTALASATKTTFSLIAAGFELFVVPGILLLIISPFIILVLWINNQFALKDKLTVAVEKIEKEVDLIIKNLSAIVDPIKKRIKIRQEIQKINQLMAATKQNRKDYINEQESEKQKNRVDQLTADNDTESQAT